MEELQIALITVCRNRLHHLQQTLPQNIRDNASCPGVYFLVLDYNSSDGLTDWITAEMQPHLQSGLLRFYRTNEPECYHHAHSRNMAFLLADADLLCNLDADNYTGKDFALYLRKRFMENRKRILITFGGQQKKASSDTYGRVCVTRNDFLSVNGYDENIELYGGVDIDLAHRVAILGREKLVMEEESFLHCIKHPDTERFIEMRIYRDLYACYVAITEGQLYYLLLLFKNQSFELAMINKERSAARPEDNTLDEGSYLWDEDGLHLKFLHGYTWNLQGNSAGQPLKSAVPDITWFRVQSKEGLATWAVQYMYVKTSSLMKSGKAVNEQGFGQGYAYQLQTCIIVETESISYGDL